MSMRLKYVILFCCALLSMEAYTQSTTCVNAEPFCAGDDTLTFPNTINAGMAESGPNYGCLVSQPNPTWYFLRIDEPGNLSFRIVQNSREDLSGDALDVDFIAYGPFDDTEVCSGSSLNESKIVGCSYSLDAVEEFDLLNTQAGEFYLLLITNFDNQPGFIQLQQTNTGPDAGTTDCSIVNTTNYCVGDIVSVDATTENAVRYEWEKDGVLITGETGPILAGLEAPGATYNARSYDSNNMVISRYEYTLVFNEVPVANTIGGQSICDDNNDGIGQFDLSLYDSLVLNGQDPDEFVVSYYSNQADADALENVLPTNYTTNAPYQQETLVARIENINNSDCYDTSSFTIDVFDGAIANAIEDQTYCDDNNDGIGNFNFVDYEPVLLGSQDAANFNVTFHSSEMDAENNVNPLPSNYTNSTAYQEETIYVRIENSANTFCYDITSFLIDVADTPQPNFSPGNIELCDDASNDEVEVFDLTELEDVILNGETGVSVVYFDNPTGPNTGENPISNPTSYTNVSNPQLIYARVIDDVSGCFAIVDFQLVVNPIPVIPSISDYILCENATDGFASFDLNTKNAEILNGLNPATYEVSYHLSQSDAENLNAPLNSPYVNTVNPQQIFVAVTNVNVGCTVSDQSFFLEVQEVLEANSDGIPIVLEQCDDFGENDGLAQFDLSSVDLDVLDGQDPSIYGVNYYLTQDDADNGINELNKNYENSALTETLYARVDNFNLSDSRCFATTTITIRVNLLPDFDLNDQYAFCTNSNGSEVVPIPILRTNLSSTQYTFEWTFNSQVITGQTRPTLIPSQPGTYGVTVTNVSTLCSSTDTADVFESSRPTIELEVTSRPFSEQNSITVTATGTGDFEYSLDNGQWQDEPVFENVRAGRHVVRARDKFGCGVASASITVIGYSKYFTPNGDGYHDTWNVFGIDSQPDAKIYIFDRFGKLLKQLSPTSAGWNGTFNGVNMPTSDYWFLIEYNEPSTGQRTEYRSHFTLKR